MSKLRVSKILALIVIVALVSTIVFVSDNVMAAGSLQISSKEIKLELGKSKQLSIKGIKSSKIKWYSTKSGVATVKNGKVKALSAGTTTITAVYGNRKAYCKVKVTAKSKEKYSKEQYRFGRKPEADIYIFYAKDKDKMSCIEYNGSDETYRNITFKYCYILQVNYGDKVVMHNAYMRKFKESVPNTSGEGMFKVGTNIRAGKYIVSSLEEKDAYVEIYDSNFGIIDSYTIGLNSSKAIKLKKGQYIRLIDGKLRYKE